MAKLIISTTGSDPARPEVISTTDKPTPPPTQWLREGGEPGRLWKIVRRVIAAIVSWWRAGFDPERRIIQVRRRPLTMAPTKRPHYTTIQPPPIPDHCRHGNCPCRCIAAARETFDKHFDARKLPKLFEAIEQLRGKVYIGEQKFGIATVTITATRDSVIIPAAEDVIDAFDELKMEQ